MYGREPHNGAKNKMKSNNRYYKIIAKLLDESVDNRHHTDLYYTKRIAESYDESYSDLGNVNKYLKEFAEDVGVELDGKHHTRLWYLRAIADKLYDGELEHNTENYYLKIISENLNPTPPTPLTFNLKVTFNDNPVIGKSIIDNHYGGEEYTTDDNGEIKNIPYPKLYESQYYESEGTYYVSDLLDGVSSFLKYDYPVLHFYPTDDSKVYTKYKYKENGSKYDLPTTPFTFWYKLTKNSVTLEVITE